MGEVINFVHYLNTGEVVAVLPCGRDGHNRTHVRIYELEDKFFIYCNYCQESALGLAPDDFYKFIDGLNPKWICERPYHHPKLIICGDDGEYVCSRCMVSVRKADHPSHGNNQSWYG